MTFNLPTISSLNRQTNITLRPPRNRRENTLVDGQVCTHRSVAHGRCPVCYRLRVESYGRRIRQSVRRNRVPPAPPPISRRRYIPPPSPRRPILPFPVFVPHARRPLPVFSLPRPRPPSGRPLRPRYPIPQPPPPPPRPIYRSLSVIRPVPTSSSYLSNMGLKLPGRCIIMIDKQLVCPICYNNYITDQNCQVLPCDHTFHAWCLSKWFSLKQNCPLCRREYGMSNMP